MWKQSQHILLVRIFLIINSVCRVCWSSGGEEGSWGGEGWGRISGDVPWLITLSTSPGSAW